MSRPIAVTALLTVLLWYASRAGTPPVPDVPQPTIPVPRKPLLPRPRGPEKSAVKDHIGGPSHDGRELQCDLWADDHLRNKGGRDGLGLCVFTSIDMAARWQNVPALVGFRDFMTQHPGGGHPQKVAAMIPKAAAAKQLSAPGYWQFTDGDTAKLRRILDAGRIACVTYGYSPRYGGSIAHMVCLVHLDEKWAVVLDNNFPGIDRYEWVGRDEFLRRWRMGAGGGWAVCLTAPPPPPIPVNP